MPCTVTHTACLMCASFHLHFREQLSEPATAVSDAGDLTVGSCPLRQLWFASAITHGNWGLCLLSGKGPLVFQLLGQGPILELLNQGSFLPMAKLPQNLRKSSPLSPQPSCVPGTNTSQSSRAKPLVRDRVST